jgi:SPP1 gp7 family putative phage head morphogenesis protein
MRYVKALRGVMRTLHEDTMKLLRPELPELTGRTDGHTWLSSTFDVHIGRQVARISDLVGGFFDRQARSALDENAKANKVLGIRSSDLRLGAELSKRRNENIQLVEKAARSYAQDVRDIFESPDVNGMRVEELAAKLEERGNVSESRAELIARDQTLKLNGAITQIRQENAGIDSYVWSTSLDERVRPEHAALEGQTFPWSSPPDVGHPGQDIQCRCIAVPVIASDS